MTATAILQLLQPYLVQAAGKAAESIGEAMPSALGRLWSRLRVRASESPASSEALEDLVLSPGDSDVQAAFRVQLRKLLEKDAELTKEASAVLQHVASQNSAQVVGSGAIAQGPHSQAFGANSIVLINDREIE